MSQGKSAVRTVISVTLVVLTVLGLINVYGDNADVIKLAEQIDRTLCRIGIR